MREPEERDSQGTDEAMVITELQLVLAEKRTWLSVLRTGIAVSALPLTVVSFLIVTSRLYDMQRVMNLIVPLLVACLGLFALGVSMIVRAVRRLHHDDQVLGEMKKRLPEVGHLID